MYSLNPLFSSRKTGAPFDQAQLNQIKDYLDKGFNKKEIRELTGISSEALNRRIKENDWSARKKRTSGLTQQELNEIKEKYDKGILIEELSKEYHISLKNLADRVANGKWTKKPRKTQYNCDETYFDKIDTEHKAYWLGFLFADGYILSKRERGRNESQSFGFSINIKDIELFEKFKQDLKSNHPVNIYSSSSNFSHGGDFGRILVTSQHMVDCLKSYGMIEHKTTVLKMPNLPQELVPHFIRGYSDGDGSIVISHLKSGKIKYFWDITSTKEICEAFLVFFNKSELKLYERDVNNYTMRICGKQQTSKILSIIYKDATIYLERKYKKYAEMQGISV